MSQYKNTRKYIITLITTPSSTKYSLFPSLIFILCSFLCSVQSVLIIDSFQISSLTNYTLQVSQFTTLAPAGSLIQLQLPFLYSADDLYARRPYTGQMYDGFCPTDCSTVAVSYSGYIFNITGMFPNDDLLAFQYTITNVPNPRIAATVSGYIIRVIDPSQNIIYSENVASKIFTPKPMSCIGTAIDFNAVNFISTAYFTINPLTNPSDYPVALIMIEFPSIWSLEPIVGSTLPSETYCLSISQPKITCQRNSQIITLFNVTFSASIDVEIHSIMNPSSMMGAGLVTLSTMTSSRVKIDTCSINITGLTQDYLRLPSMTISYQSNTLLDIAVSITFPSRVASGTSILFTFPSNLPMSSVTCKTYLAGILLSSVSATYISSNNTIRVSPFTGLIFKPSIQLQCLGVTRPRNALLVGNISVNSYYNGFLVAGISCCSVLLKPRASLDVTSIITDKPYLQTSNCQYFFTFATTMPLLSTDMIYIYFPKEYLLGTGTKPCAITSATASTGSPTCTILNGNLILVTSFITADILSSATFQLKISAIQNPVQNPSYTPFQIYILNAARQTIEYNSTKTVTISAASINTFTVTATNLQVLSNPVQYIAQFTTNGIIGINYYVVLILPVEVGVSLSTLNCLINGQSHPCWYNSPQNSIKVRVTTNLISTSVTLTINSLINPESLAPTQKFTLQILDPNQNIIQISSILLITTVTMTTTRAFKNLYLNFNTSSTVFPLIHSTNILQIIAISPKTIKSSHQLIITYNTSQILFNAASQSSTCSPLCNIDTVNKIINVSNIASTPNTDTLYLNITNVIALVPNPILTIEMWTNVGYKILSSIVTTSPVLPDLISYNLTQSNWQFSISSDITIDYLINALNASSPSLSSVTGLSYLLVYVPNQYTTFATGNIYNITTLNGHISISGIINPSYISYTSSVFYIAGYNAINQLIAISINNKKFSPLCTMPCRTCPSSSTTNCTNCYSWHSLNVLFTNSTTSLTTCVSNCPRYYYQDNITMSCKICDVNCLQCDIYISNKCLSCVSTKALHEVDNKCYTMCPNGYYKIGLVCRGCTPNCLTCLNQTYCYTCTTGIYLYNNSCISACPPKTYSTLSPLTCTDCPTTNCQHCNQSQCLSCITPYYIYNKQCYLACPAPLFPTISRTCKICQCATCFNYANNCTLCSLAAPFLHNNYCYSSCPKGMYAGTSKICANCPFSCVTCTSSNICTLCKQTYAIIIYSITNISCITASGCPLGTILTLSSSDIPTCSPCTTPCATCSITPTFCLTCNENYSLHNNTCVLLCPVPYHAINYVCEKCISVCLLCLDNDPQNCTQCQPNYFLFNSTCYTSCPIGTYTDVSNKQCAQCNPTCRTCSNSTNCTSCKTGNFLYNWLCYSSCPTTPIFYFQYNGICTPCQPQCTSCIDSPISCTSCSHPNYIYNILTHQCVFQCLPPYFKNGTYCVACQTPCVTCDTTYYACSSCQNEFLLFNGTCISSCPVGYFGNSTTKICQLCIYPCKICIQNQCLLCQSFSYIYKRQCVLVCPDDMPYEQPGYCSECVGIGFCAKCGTSSATDKQICTQCVYPYVLFQQSCLNQCPTNYTAITTQNGGRECTKSDQYLKYLLQKQNYNKPIMPPFFFIGLYLILILFFGLLSQKLYRFTYHVGFMVGLLAIFDAGFVYYSMYFVYTRYEGQYIPVAPMLPFAFILAAVLLNYGLLTLIFWCYVLRKIYLTDLRYEEWKDRNIGYWWVSTLIMIVLGGPRLHKINYSKIFGLDKFAFRIVSDIITYLSGIGDMLQICAGAICVYNIFITNYSGLLFIGYETFGIKLVMWILLLYDLKKPDRGFFIGDEEQAQIQIMKQLQQQVKNMNRVNTENFVKLVRTKSAELIRNPKYFGNLDIDDFISVYNPDDYQQVPKVPNRKIQKNIYRGKYRRGKKITMQQKINRFVDSIKPKPILKKQKSDNAYLWKLIYWRPPDFNKIKPKPIVPAHSQHSLLALLEQKQIEYKQQLDDIELVQDQKKQRKYYTKPKYNQRNFLDDLDETIPNDTVEFFYPSHSIETQQKQASIDFDDLMNLNYARRKHLSKKQQEQENHLKYESKRKLHHEPHKKRRDLKGIGQRIVQNQF